jgi:hypothetical protein
MFSRPICHFLIFYCRIHKMDGSVGLDLHVSFLFYVLFGKPSVEHIGHDPAVILRYNSIYRLATA